MRKRVPEQLHLDSLRHGGRRAGAGGPRSKTGVLHAPRPSIAAYHVVHVTMRIAAGLPSLRSTELHAVVADVIRTFQGSDDFRVIEYSLQDDHLHQLAEGTGQDAFERGMRGLTIRTALGINRALGRTGPLFPERYHAEVIDNPRQMRAAYAYVLNKRRKHSDTLIPFKDLWVDPFSSAPFFGGWSVPPRIPAMVTAMAPSPVAEPRTWLARTGWRQHSLIHPEEVPGSGFRATRRRAA